MGKRSVRELKINLGGIWTKDHRRLFPDTEAGNQLRNEYDKDMAKAREFKMSKQYKKGQGPKDTSRGTKWDRHSGDWYAGKNLPVINLDNALRDMMYSRGDWDDQMDDRGFEGTLRGDYIITKDGDMDELVDNITDDVGNHVKRVLQAAMEIEGKYATGKMHDSWEYDPEAKVVGNTDKGILGVEFGTLPGHTVPIEQLEKWARHKLKVGKLVAESIARKVQGKIYREGIPETRIVYRTLDFAVNEEKWLAWNRTG